MLTFWMFRHIITTSYGPNCLQTPCQCRFPSERKPYQEWYLLRPCGTNIAQARGYKMVSGIREGMMARTHTVANMINPSSHPNPGPRRRPRIRRPTTTSARDATIQLTMSSARTEPSGGRYTRSNSIPSVPGIRKRDNNAQHVVVSCKLEVLIIMRASMNKIIVYRDGVTKDEGSFASRVSNLSVPTKYGSRIDECIHRLIHY